MTTIPDSCTRRWELAAALTSAALARASVRQALLVWGLAGIADDVELMTGELVANAVTHGRGPVIVELAIDDGRPPRRDLVCGVSDSSLRLPEPGQPGLLDESGRGLPIVAALATATGARLTCAGKTVWFRIRLPERPPTVDRSPAAIAEAALAPQEKEFR